MLVSLLEMCKELRGQEWGYFDDVDCCGLLARDLEDRVILDIIDDLV